MTENLKTLDINQFPKATEIKDDDTLLLIRPSANGKVKPMRVDGNLIPKVTDVARTKQSLGPYTDRPDIVLAASQTGYVVSKDGVKTAKSGWAMAEFTAELGNEYLFKPGATDGNVCVFAEYIDKVERRAIEYAYTYDEKGRVATAKATYDGNTHSYTYAYTTQESTAAAGTEAQSEVCVITNDQTGQTVDYLPATFQTKVGSY